MGVDKLGGPLSRDFSNSEDYPVQARNFASSAKFTLIVQRVY